MKRIAVLISTMLVVSKIHGQVNLVPNPSFEVNAGCPGWPQISLAVDWVNPTPASPDYHNACDTFNIYSVPYNAQGFQYARSGVAYAGIINFAFGGREYIQAQLTDTLEAGEWYCVSYFISLSEESAYATKAPQVHFSNNPISSGSTMNMNYMQHIANGLVISDTVQWVKIEGLYVATGGERFITIGNFNNNANTPYDAASGPNPAAYYYIDDVSVIESINSLAGSDMTICFDDSTSIGSSTQLPLDILCQWSPALGLSDSTSSHPWASPSSSTTYYLTISDTGNRYCVGRIIDSVTITVEDCTTSTPLSFPKLVKRGDIFEITSLPENSTLEIFDSRGRLVFRQDNYQNTFNTANLTAGVYLYFLLLPDQTFHKGKFCVVQ